MTVTREASSDVTSFTEAKIEKLIFNFSNFIASFTPSGYKNFQSDVRLRFVRRSPLSFFTHLGYVAVDAIFVLRGAFNPDFLRKDPEKS